MPNPAQQPAAEYTPIEQGDAFSVPKESLGLPQLEDKPAHQTPYIDVSIISNDRLMCERLPHLLSAYTDLHLVDTYRERFDSRLEVQMLPRPANHVVLLDGSMNRQAALIWIRYWHSVTPPALVVVFAMANDSAAIVRFIEAGAGGCVLQGAPENDIIDAIRLIVHSLAVFSPKVTALLCARLASYGSGEQPPPLSPSPIPVSPVPTVPNVSTTPLTSIPRTPKLLIIPLTRRELEVLGYVAAKYTDKKIAHVLVIQVPTAKHHVQNILLKLDLHHRRDAARRAIEQGWLDPPRPD